MTEQTLSQKKNDPAILMETWNTIVRYGIENYLLLSLATYGNNSIFGFKLVINSGNFHNAKPAARNIFVIINNILYQSFESWLSHSPPPNRTDFSDNAH